MVNVAPMRNNALLRGVATHGTHVHMFDTHVT